MEMSTQIHLSRKQQKKVQIGDAAGTHRRCKTHGNEHTNSPYQKATKKVQIGDAAVRHMETSSQIHLIRKLKKRRSATWL
jgi:hypothetical protein